MSDELLHYYKESELLEIGVDEAGRGPLFGRLYTAGVILPKTDIFNHSIMCDSKKIKSFKKLEKLATYIKENAIAWSVNYETEEIIDKINIRQSVLKCMHSSIKRILEEHNIEKAHLLIDGTDFKPFTYFKNNEIITCDHTCIKGGDNTYSSIAAASILAKYERDKYILELCDNHTALKELYGIDSNKGYGTKKHLDGIKEHGITKWHRKSYGICKESKINSIQ